MPCERRDADKRRKKMPKERVKHGNLYATREVGEEEATSLGIPAGVHFERYYPGTVAPPGSSIREEVSLDLGWNKDAEVVQFSLHIPGEKWKELLELYTEDTEGTPKDIYTETLTRYEINAMIKALRRARDTAFGSDE
jgi:hypothetical protein